MAVTQTAVASQPSKVSLAVQVAAVQLLTQIGKVVAAQELQAKVLLVALDTTPVLVTAVTAVVVELERLAVMVPRIKVEQVVLVYLLVLMALLHSVLAVEADTLIPVEQGEQAVVDAVVSGLLSLVLAMRVLPILEVVEAAAVVLVAVQQAVQVLLSSVTPAHSAVQAVRSRLQTDTQSIHLLRQEHTHHDYYQAGAGFKRLSC